MIILTTIIIAPLLTRYKLFIVRDTAKKRAARKASDRFNRCLRAYNDRRQNAKQNVTGAQSKSNIKKRETKGEMTKVRETRAFLTRRPRA